MKHTTVVPAYGRDYKSKKGCSRRLEGREKTFLSATCLTAMMGNPSINRMQTQRVSP